MKINEVYPGGPVIIEPKVFADSRGYFFESYNDLLCERLGISSAFCQDNESFSSRHVLRGLHFQNPPYEQGKLVRVVLGSVLDVVVDIRKNSPELGKTFSIELNSENKKMLWIPPGFAHGFITLSDNTIFLYKCTKSYNKESESGIIWNDKTLNIDWGIQNPLVSEKDLLLPEFSHAYSLF